MSAAAPARAGLARHAVPAVAAILAVATVAVGLYEDANGRLLGVPHPPFIGALEPEGDAAGCCSRSRASPRPSRSSSRC